MIQPNVGLTQDILSEEEQRWEEEWEVILTSKGKYALSKMQALVVKQAIAEGSRGTIMFETFAIAIPYVTDFYRIKRFLKGVKALPERATEEEYIPMDPKKWEAMKKKFYEKIGKPMPEGAK